MNNLQIKSRLLEKLTGTQTPKFITERENVLIDKFVEIIKDFNQQIEDKQKELDELKSK